VFKSSKRGRVHLTDGKTKGVPASLKTFLASHWSDDEQGLYLFGANEDKSFCPVQLHPRDSGRAPPLSSDIPSAVDLIQWFYGIIQGNDEMVGPRYDHQQFFLTRGRACTDFHYDSYDNFYVAASGIRRWTLACPEASRWFTSPGSGPLKSGSDVNPSQRLFPPGSPAQIYPYCHLELFPGDVLFVPACWWHSVDSSSSGSDTCSAAFNYFFAGPPDKVFVDLRTRLNRTDDMIGAEKDRIKHVPIERGGGTIEAEILDEQIRLAPGAVPQPLWDQLLTLVRYMEGIAVIKRFWEQHNRSCIEEWKPCEAIESSSRPRGRPARKRNPNAGRKPKSTSMSSSHSGSNPSVSELAYLKRVAYRDHMRERRKTAKAAAND
jgi:hypothetical protein